MQLDPYNAGYKEAMSFIAKLFYEENYSYGVLAAVRFTLSASCPSRMGKLLGKMKQ